MKKSIQIARPATITLSGLLVALCLLACLAACGGEVNVNIPGCEDCPDRCIANKEQTRGVCVTCIKDSQCQSHTSPTSRCNADNKCICGSDKDCPNKLVCAGEAGCVQCLRDGDCGDGKICENDKCITCRRGSTRECTPNNALACGKGQQTCESSQSWGECKPSLLCKEGEVCEGGKCVIGCKPALEICNGKDDDCDGTVDNNLADEGLTCSVPNQKGACAVSRFKCVEGKLVCNKTSEPKDETCNGQDDDCDGAIDNLPDLGQKCNDSKREGLCKAGVWTCEKNQKTCKQVVQASKEVCDQQDNDCNGKIDDGIDCSCVLADPPRDCYTGPSNTEGTGLCKKGQQKCESFSGGFRWGKCVGETTPQTETCDGEDNDCNGKVDDGQLADAGKPCTVKGAKGSCAAGQTACQSGSIICRQVNQPQAETCNNTDDDCDGTVDNIAELGQPCTDSARKGVCQAGVWICAAGKKTCQQSVQPATETCNGKDDDCNGKIDDLTGAGQACTDPNRLGPCQAGTLACEGGRQVCKASVAPATETCNGKDDDCDGKVDNIADAGRSCLDGTRKGVCQAGVWACVDNQKACKQTVTPAAQETCANFKDDNCDGVIDEGCPCNYLGLSQGVCKDAKADSQGICQKPPNYSPNEVCSDGKDNDCDGKVDKDDPECP